MANRATMNQYERTIYNEAQALYKQAQRKRDEAYRAQDERLKGEDEERKAKLAKAKELKEQGERQEFSNRINRICLALGDAVKKESLQIDGGGVTTSMWGVPQSSEKKIFTIHNFSFPRMTADVYAVANKGFRWEIRMA